MEHSFDSKVQMHLNDDETCVSIIVSLDIEATLTLRMLVDAMEDGQVQVSLKLPELPSN